MKYIFSSDPHGTGLPWIEKIQRAKTMYPDAVTVFGGDYIDGREFSKETLAYVMNCVLSYNDIALLGNHEQMMLDFINSGNDLWFINGAKSTIKSLTGRGWSRKVARSVLKNQCYDTLNWIKSLSPSFITENIAFVHAGFNLSTDDPFTNTPKDEQLWVRDSYIYEDDFVTFKHNTTHKTIVSGHTPTCTINGLYTDGRKFNKYNTKVQIRTDEYDCPVIEVSYPKERKRIFTDGGCHGDIALNTGNVIVLDDNGNLIYQEG